MKTALTILLTLTLALPSMAQTPTSVNLSFM
jgi:hypothetical protein